MSRDELGDINRVLYNGNRRYELISKLGSGSMGNVYKAIDHALDRVVAIKTIRLDSEIIISDISASVVSFIREARIIANLDHPSIAKIFDIRKSGETDFFIMECVDGESVEESINKICSLDLASKLSLIIKIADALNHAHIHDVIHRDIRPANIMIRKNGSPVIMDFGLAKFKYYIDSAVDRKNFKVYGQPAYISPEQILGHDVDQSSDIFSLGAVAYKIITGKNAFEALLPGETFRMITQLTPTPPSKLTPYVSGNLDAIIGKVLSKNKHERYLTAADFGCDLVIERNKLLSSGIELIDQLEKNKETIEHIKSTYPLFTTLSDLDLLELFDVLEKKDFKAGETIFSEGEYGDNMYAIIDGEVEIRKNLPDSHQYDRLALLKKGDCFGEIAVIDKGGRTGSVVALKDSSLIIISGSNIESLRPELAKKLYMNISRIITKKYRDFLSKNYDSFKTSQSKNISFI